mmetsp:Transcript_58272/g.137358  ORF Transcript_58272/g.137358 Transcript_58272/m.137358 type:complete len:331 (-) Transcript_58272:22-1014(-)
MKGRVLVACLLLRAFSLGDEIHNHERMWSKSGDYYHLDRDVRNYAQNSFTKDVDKNVVNAGDTFLHHQTIWAKEMGNSRPITPLSDDDSNQERSWQDVNAVSPDQERKEEARDHFKHLIREEMERAAHAGVSKVHYGQKAWLQSATKEYQHKIRRVHNEMEALRKQVTVKETAAKRIKSQIENVRDKISRDAEAKATHHVAHERERHEERDRRDRQERSREREIHQESHRSDRRNHAHSRLQQKRQQGGDTYHAVKRKFLNEVESRLRSIKRSVDKVHGGSSVSKDWRKFDDEVAKVATLLTRTRHVEGVLHRNSGHERHRRRAERGRRQ